MNHVIIPHFHEHVYIIFRAIWIFFFFHRQIFPLCYNSVFHIKIVNSAPTLLTKKCYHVAIIRLVRKFLSRSRCLKKKNNNNWTHLHCVYIYCCFSSIYDNRTISIIISNNCAEVIDFRINQSCNFVYIHVYYYYRERQKDCDILIYDNLFLSNFYANLWSK